MTSHRFAHVPLFTVNRGKIKVACTGPGCGAQSKKLDTWEEAEDAYRTHLALIGLAEKQKMK